MTLFAKRVLTTLLFVVGLPLLIVGVFALGLVAIWRPQRIKTPAAEYIEVMERDTTGPAPTIH